MFTIWMSNESNFNAGRTEQSYILIIKILSNAWFEKNAFKTVDMHQGKILLSQQPKPVLLKQEK